MSATLDALQTLQQIELKLIALRSKIDHKRRAVRTHERRIEQLNSELAAKHDSIKQRQVTLARLELECKSREQEITRLREVLNRSKTNKEYAAVLSQINVGKADHSKLEDRVLEMMNEIEQLRREEEDIRTHIEQERQRLDNAQKVTAAFERDSQKEMEALQREREEAAAAIPAQTLSIFERVAERHEGEALARVQRPHPRRDEFICEGCNMGVTLDQFARMQSPDDIVVCNNCGRLLYLDDKPS